MKNRIRNKVENAELKSIMHSKRANLYYLEMCRVMQKDGRILYITQEEKENAYWNIPIANTTVILLGTGTSITQAAMRMLASAGVLVGFCGGGGTPLFAGTEIEWLSPQNEYRPTQYVQGWLKFWVDENKRLTVAKIMQSKRCDFVKQVFGKDRNLADAGFYADDMEIENAIATFHEKINSSENITNLLLSEAQFAKSLYHYAAEKTGDSYFVRDVDGKDSANRFLNHGNYLAYGLAATTLWTLGIPHAFAVMHGKTRRGALVFDVADLIKDAIVLPFSFICANEYNEEQDFRDFLVSKFIEHKVLDYMFEVVENCALNGGV